MRAGLFGLAVAALTTAAVAQVDAPGSPAGETSRPLPFRDTGNEIRIEVDADLLYSFEDSQVRASASDLLAQAATLIEEHARSPVRIECRSDRTPAAAAQKMADACGAALAQYLVAEEKVANVKFTSVGVSVPPARRDPRDPFAPLPPRQSKVLIVFGKR